MASAPHDSRPLLSVVVLAMVFASALPVSVAPARTQVVPSDLLSLLVKARVDGKLVGWCGGEFQAGRRGAFAVAVSRGDGGHYLVIDADATTVELAPFTGAGEVACYTSGDARKLGASINQSETIRGRIIPLFKTAVVCAFVENTSAVCWQYSPTVRRFVRVGEWET